jgi:predicted nucleotidyltransferase
MPSKYTQVPSLIQPLELQIEGLKKILKNFKLHHLIGIALFGSCSKGKATYRSDIDLIFIFDQQDLNFSFVKNTRDEVENYFKSLQKENLLEKPLPVEIQVVRDSVFLTTETEMINNLKHCLILLDLNGKLQTFKEKFHE